MRKWQRKGRTRTPTRVCRLQSPHGVVSSHPVGSRMEKKQESHRHLAQVFTKHLLWSQPCSGSHVCTDPVMSGWVESVGSVM